MIRVSARVRAFPNGCQRRAGMARSILGALSTTPVPSLALAQARAQASEWTMEPAA